MSLLSCRGLTRAWGAFRAVDGVDLDLAEREICAVIGPNGAGKSTLFAMIAGNLRKENPMASGWAYKESAIFCRQKGRMKRLSSTRNSTYLVRGSTFFNGIISLKRCALDPVFGASITASKSALKFVSLIQLICSFPLNSSAT